MADERADPRRIVPAKAGRDDPRGGEQGQQPSPTAPKQVSCSVCKKLIPASAAIAPEAREYVLYFCGGECHADWLRTKGVDRGVGGS